MTHSTRALLAISLIVLALPIAASAQGQGGKPPAPDLAGMANALNVSEEHAKSCLPAPQKGQRPAKPNVKTLTTCFKAANSALTEQQVGDALKAFGPQHPPKK